MSYGLDSPFQANLVGGRTNQVGSLSNSPGERSAPNNRMYSRFAAQAASGSSNSTVYSPSYNQSFNSLYYSPGTSIGLPRSASAIKQQIKGNQTMHLRTAISYSPTITGLHPGDSGFATSTIRGMTAFGSGFDIQKFLGWAYANPVGQGLSEMLIYGKPEFKTKRREFELGTYALLGGWARGGPLGAAVALGATSAAIYGGYKLNEAIQGGPDRHKRGYGTELLSFMSYGAVSGGLFAGTESGLLKGTLGGNLARQAYDLVSKQATKISHGHFNMPAGPMEGLEPGLEDWVNPFRRFKQGSIVEQAEFFHDPKIFGWRLPVPGLSKENAIKFSEAYHGYSAFVLREAATFGGVKNIPRGNYYKALAKDVGIGALGGLYEGTILGAAYIGLHWLGHKLFGHKKDNKIDGLHPGNQGFATQAIRQYTSFGSEHDPFKAINMGKFIYSGNATRQRQWANRALSIINKPDANIIGFDIETGGLLSQLEPGVRTGAQRSSIFEFAIKSNKKETYGFTPYASAEAYANLVNQGGDFSKQFGLAMRRYMQYHGKPYSATDIVSEIGSHIIPGKTNILLGHNLNWFDLKMLSADYAIEQGFISKKDITRFHELGMGPKTNGEEYNRLQQVVTEGWGKANNAILKSWALKRGNLKIIDTLGTSRVSKYIVPMRSTQEGLVRNILGGYYPGIRQHWFQRELNKNIIVGGLDPGMAAELAAHQAQFPSMVGSGLEDISAFFGRKFTGPAHHPMADISNTIEFVKSRGLRSRLKAMDLAINNKAERFINREHVRYLANQRMIAERTLSNGSTRSGKLSLANDIIEGTSGLASPTTNTFKTGLNKWWGELPTKNKIGYGILGAATAYMGLKAIFGSRTRYTDDQPQVPSGMHYGNRGYATQIIRSQTDFGSSLILGKALSRASRFLKLGRTSINEFGSETGRWLKKNWLPKLKSGEPAAIITGLAGIGSIAHYAYSVAHGMPIEAASSLMEFGLEKYGYMAYTYRQYLPNTIKLAGAGIKQLIQDPKFRSLTAKSVSNTYKTTFREVGDYIVRDRNNLVRSFAHKGRIGIKDYAIQKIEGIHPGAAANSMGTQAIQSHSEFGSGWRGLIKLPEELASEFFGWKAEAMMGFRIGTQKGFDDLYTQVERNVNKLSGTASRAGSNPLAIQMMQQLDQKNVTPGIHKFYNELQAAKKAGYAGTEIVFISEKGINSISQKLGIPKSQLLKNAIRHERQHVYHAITNFNKVRNYQTSKTMYTWLYGQGYQLQKINMARAGEQDLAALTFKDEALAHMAGFAASRSKSLPNLILSMVGLTEETPSGIFGIAKNMGKMALGPIAKELSAQTFDPAARDLIQEIRQDAYGIWQSQGKTKFGARIDGLHPKAGNKSVAKSWFQKLTDFGSPLNLPKALLRAMHYLSGELPVEELIEKHTIIAEHTDKEIKYLADRFVNKNKFKDFMLKDSGYKVKLKPTNGLVNGVLDQNAIAHDRAMSRMPINI